MNPEDRLVPETLTSSLRTSWVGRSLRCVQTTGSTNADGLSLLAAGVARGTVIIAEQQTAGRGRAGRTWVAPPGRCLTLSIIVLPTGPPATYPLYTFAASLAVCAAVRSTTGNSQDVGASPLVKWPNDVYLNGRKIAGVLVDVGRDSSGKPGLVVGIGLNVNLSAEELTEMAVENAASIQSEIGRSTDRMNLLVKLLEEFERRADKLAEGRCDEIVSEWRAHSETIGRHIEVQTGEGIRVGYAEDVGEDGSLWVRTALGAPEKIALSEIRHLR